MMQRRCRSAGGSRRIARRGRASVEAGRVGQRGSKTWPPAPRTLQPPLRPHSPPPTPLPVVSDPGLAVVLDALAAHTIAALPFGPATSLLPVAPLVAGAPTSARAQDRAAAQPAGMLQIFALVRGGRALGKLLVGELRQAEQAKWLARALGANAATAAGRGALYRRGRLLLAYDGRDHDVEAALRRSCPVPAAPDPAPRPAGRHRSAR